eukprot:4801081-Pyramimonas_sp.AAC.1
MLSLRHEVRPFELLAEQLVLTGGDHSRAHSPNPWRRARQVAGGPAQRAEHELDWHGQGAQRAGWRNEAIAIMTARLQGHLTE